MLMFTYLTTQEVRFTAPFNLCTTIIFRRHGRNHQCRHEQKRFDAGHDHDKPVEHASLTQDLKYPNEFVII